MIGLWGVNNGNILLLYIYVLINTEQLDKLNQHIMLAKVIMNFLFCIKSSSLKSMIKIKAKMYEVVDVCSQLYMRVEANLTK